MWLVMKLKRAESGYYYSYAGLSLVSTEAKQCLFGSY